MAGSDIPIPATNVSKFRNDHDRQLHSTNKVHINTKQYNQTTTVCIDDGQDEATPFHCAENSTSSASLLSITRTIRQLTIAATCLIISVLFNLTTLAIVHERVPLSQPPLPDVAFSLLPKNDHALDISEYIIMFMTTSLLLIIVFHRYRSIIFRRLCFILSILYLLRALCMAGTQLPVANPQYYCSPQLNLSEHFGWWNFTKVIISRVTHLSVGMGLSVNGRHSFCGDYIFSGHTVMLVTTFLFLNEYWLRNRRRFWWRAIKWSYLALVLTGIFCILIARGHYVVDIVIAYIIASRIYFIYHCACDDALRTEPNTRFRSLWWFHLFRFIESDTIEHRIRVENVFEMFEWFSRNKSKSETAKTAFHT